MCSVMKLRKEAVVEKLVVLVLVLLWFEIGLFSFGLTTLNCYCNIAVSNSEGKREKKS